ncbi:toll/interleukin-1 receptor domain-containing protein [Frankia sp. CiP3]|uniref:toll/interleukin-1 receptor domain-containing protein n=1 Tax=Frankia sp. CiP3 TaxID=2880971 RepID=UPI001EF5A144|nr:toll/interleukin-1 receptor domain-containing protein [Frankia sp. CiP3]
MLGRVQYHPDAGPQLTRWDFFLSYGGSSIDQRWAEWIAWVLEEAGYRVLVPAWDEVPGTSWAGLADEGVRRGGHLIAVLSSTFLESEHATAIWRAVWASDQLSSARRIIPVRVEPRAFSGLLADRVAIDLTAPARRSDEAQAGKLLLAGVEAARTGRNRPTALVPMPERTVRRRPRLPTISSLLGTGRSSGEPPDLLTQRRWVAKITADYEQAVAAKEIPGDRKQRRQDHRELEQLARTLDGSPDGAGKKVLRGLLASGVVTYCPHLGELPDDSLPEQVGLDLAYFALWPLITARKLPKDWADDLAEISSPSLASLVEAVRSATARGVKIGTDDFQRLLAQTPVAFGILNMLQDLNDPARGAAALLAVAKAGSRSEPPRGAGAKIMVTWLALAASAGAAGPFGVDAERHASGLADGLWDWLTDHHSGAGYGGSSEFDPFGGSGDRHTSALDQLVEGLFHDIF